MNIWQIYPKRMNYFLSIDKNTNDMWEKFDAEFEISLDKQKKLEQLQEVSFEEFLNSYINS